MYWEAEQTLTFSFDLHHTDRAWWSVVRTTWRQHRNWSTSHSPSRPGAAKVPILFAGPLRDMPHSLGVPPQFRFIRRYCGAVVADDSYAVISGPRNGLALQGVLVFLNRRGHVLLYYEYP